MQKIDPSQINQNDQNDFSLCQDLTQLLKLFKQKLACIAVLFQFGDSFQQSQPQFHQIKELLYHSTTIVKRISNSSKQLKSTGLLISTYARYFARVMSIVQYHKTKSLTGFRINRLKNFYSALEILLQRNAYFYLQILKEINRQIEILTGISTSEGQKIEQNTQLVNNIKEKRTDEQKCQSQNLKPLLNSEGLVYIKPLTSKKIKRKTSIKMPQEIIKSQDKQTFLYKVVNIQNSASVPSMKYVVNNLDCLSDLQAPINKLHINIKSLSSDQLFIQQLNRNANINAERIQYEKSYRSFLSKKSLNKKQRKNRKFSLNETTITQKQKKQLELSNNKISFTDTINRKQMSKKSINFQRSLPKKQKTVQKLRAQKSISYTEKLIIEKQQQNNFSKTSNLKLYSTRKISICINNISLGPENKKNIFEQKSQFPNKRKNILANSRRNIQLNSSQKKVPYFSKQIVISGRKIIDQGLMFPQCSIFSDRAVRNMMFQVNNNISNIVLA